MNRVQKVAIFGLFALCVRPVFGQQKPNILVIFGDDIGWYNISS